MPPSVAGGTITLLQHTRRRRIRPSGILSSDRSRLQYTSNFLQLSGIITLCAYIRVLVFTVFVMSVSSYLCDRTRNGSRRQTARDTARLLPVSDNKHLYPKPGRRRPPPTGREATRNRNLSGTDLPLPYSGASERPVAIRNYFCGGRLPNAAVWNGLC